MCVVLCTFSAIILHSLIGCCVSFVRAVYAKLYATGAFDTMSISTDEGEHSIEMHLPYIAKVMER